MQRSSQRGSVIIIVLWTMVLVTVLATTIASEIRLSAKTSFHHKQATRQWADTLAALNVAESELMLSTMPQPVESNRPGVENNRNPAYRFNGAPLQTSFPTPPGLVIRIYDHAGRMSLRRTSPNLLRKLLEQTGRVDEDGIAALIDAWRDWNDSDDLKRLNGAEKDYYESLDPPYVPRNGQLETVEELRLIKGFDEAFADSDLNTLFTMYSTHAGVNPNLASRESLALVPGLTAEVIDAILNRRQEQDFRSINDLKDLLNPEQLVQARTWLSFSTSKYYTVAIHPDKTAGGEDASAAQQRAYMVTMQVNGYAQRPKILEVRPYGVLPKAATLSSAAEI